MEWPEFGWGGYCYFFKPYTYESLSRGTSKHHDIDKTGVFNSVPLLWHPTFQSYFGRQIAPFCNKNNFGWCVKTGCGSCWNLFGDQLYLDQNKCRGQDWWQRNQHPNCPGFVLGGTLRVWRVWAGQQITHKCFGEWSKPWATLLLLLI